MPMKAEPYNHVAPHAADEEVNRVANVCAETAGVCMC